MNDNYIEALYNGERNAIPSWQGYEYQGKVAIRRYLEMLSGFYLSENNEKQALKECSNTYLKIEWLEDFIILRSENISEIYQVKKTLTKSDKEEVLANFIFQYKFLGGNNTQWFLVFDELSTQGIDHVLSENDFDNIYETVIEKGFVWELKELKNNRSVTFWKENLDLKKTLSECKKSRIYLRNLIKLESERNREIGYTTEDGINDICNRYLDTILNKFGRDKEDYQNFSSKMHMIKLPVKVIKEDCKKYIEDLSKFIQCNHALSAEDIFQKMSCDINEKLEAIKSKKEKESYIYSFGDVERVCRDEDNTKYKWNFRLSEVKEKFLNEFVKPHCNICAKNLKCQNCIGCIYAEITNWNMGTLIDSMNLEYSNFRVEEVIESIENKISDQKTDLMMDMIEYFETKCTTRQNEVVVVMDGLYFMSSILKRRNVVPKLLSNYWEHTTIYRDFEYILTDGLDYELDEENISFLKKCYEEMEQKEEDKTKLGSEVETEERITFFDTRRTKFINYKEVKI